MLEGGIESGVDDALIIVETSHHLAAGRVEELDLGACLAGVLPEHPGANFAAGREGVAELAVAAGENRQVGGPIALETPEDQELEGAVEGEGLGQPAVAQRLGQPLLRLRRRLDQGADPFRGAAGDAADAVQGRAVEESVGLVDLLVRATIGGER